MGVIITTSLSNKPRVHHSLTLALVPPEIPPKNNIPKKTGVSKHEQQAQANNNHHKKQKTLGCTLTTVGQMTRVVPKHHGQFSGWQTTTTHQRRVFSFLASFPPTCLTSFTASTFVWHRRRCKSRKWATNTDAGDALVGPFDVQLFQVGMAQFTPVQPKTTNVSTETATHQTIAQGIRCLQFGVRDVNAVRRGWQWFSIQIPTGIQDGVVVATGQRGMRHGQQVPPI
jgi:hypothetical protein